MESSWTLENGRETDKATGQGREGDMDRDRKSGRARMTRGNNMEQVGIRSMTLNMKKGLDRHM